MTKEEKEAVAGLINAGRRLLTCGLEDATEESRKLRDAHRAVGLLLRADQLAPAPRKPARVRPIGDATRDELEELRRRGVELVAGAELERQLEALRELRAVDERRMWRAS